MKTSFITLCLLLLTIFSSGHALQPQDLTGKRIAICYFGLPRSARKVVHTHIQNVIKPLRGSNIEYDVFFHTWKLAGKQRIQYHDVSIPIDYDEYKVLRPKYYRIDDQDEFTDTIDLGKYFVGGGEECWQHPNTMKNFLCALESQKRVTNMVLESGNKYDFIMYIRPDVRLDNKFDVSWLSNLSSAGIIIPDFDEYHGYNDRFAVLKLETASIYGMRGDPLANYIQNFGWKTSEYYLKYICDSNHLTPLFVNFFFHIIRP